MKIREFFFLSQLPGFDTMQHKLYDIRRSFIPAAPSTQDEFNVTSDWFQIDKESMVIADISHILLHILSLYTLLIMINFAYRESHKDCTTLRYDNIISI